MRDWLERDQLGYWQAQIKKREEQLMQARADLHKRKISQQGSDAVSDAEQKENLREAQKRLRVAEEKYAAIKKLIPFLHHEIDEYHSHSQPLGDHLAGGFEKSLFTLEKMIKSLEAYLALQAPTAPEHAARPPRRGASAASSSASTRRLGSDRAPSRSPQMAITAKRRYRQRPARPRQPRRPVNPWSLGEHHERPIGTAAARAEAPARAMGYRSGHLGRSRLARL